MRRCLGVLFAAVALGGCGTAATPAPPAATPVAAVKHQHVRVLPKKVFARRVNRICKQLNAPMRRIGNLPALTDDVATNRRIVGAWVGHYHRLFRLARRRMTRLGRPSRELARWRRAMNKLRAVESHVDELRASVWAGSGDMLELSRREIVSSAKSASRRFSRFGAKAC